MTENDEYTLHGIPASPGVSHGSALLFLPQELEVPDYEISNGDVDAELERFDQAIMETRRQITTIRNKIAASLGEGEAQIFDAHQLVLEDRALLDEVIGEVHQSGRNIEICFQKVANRYISFFNSMEDEYLKERVSDIRDVSRRLLHNLLGLRRADLGTLCDNRILVAEDISPSDTAELDRRKLLGIVTDGGSRTSHAVIMARSIRVPAVVGLRDASKRIPVGAEVLVDGYDGLVVVHPTADTLYRYGKIASARKKLDEVFDNALKDPSTTKDGFPVGFHLNIEGVDDLEQHRALAADGVGLFRTEGLFIKERTYPDEETQFACYRDVVQRMGERPVTIRTLDLGGDKNLADLTTSEQNSFMGHRAIRFCLDHPGIFRSQLRAILRASAYGNVRVMFPMISGLEQLQEAKAALEEAKKSLRADKIAFDKDLSVGCMIEVPSAAMIADLIAREVSFFSIGTNDLVQYLLAVDRSNERVAHLYEPTHPAVIRTIHRVVAAARAAEIEVSICGELAGDPVFAGFLVGCGVTALSMSSAMLSEVKFFTRNFTRADAIDLTEKLLLSTSPSESSRLMQGFYQKRLGQVLANVAES